MPVNIDQVTTKFDPKATFVGQESDQSDSNVMSPEGYNRINTEGANYLVEQWGQVSNFQKVRAAYHDSRREMYRADTSQYKAEEQKNKATVARDYRDIALNESHVSANRLKQSETRVAISGEELLITKEQYKQVASDRMLEERKTEIKGITNRLENLKLVHTVTKLGIEESASKYQISAERELKQLQGVKANIDYGNLSSVDVFTVKPSSVNIGVNDEA